jgi:1-phosphofructokinase family hexose kinase
MFLTVTPNSALDRVIFIEAFQPETTMRAARVVNSVGGKGLDASVVLRALGAPTLAISFVAGVTGQQLAALLEGYGISADLIWVESETRTAHVIVEAACGRHSHIMTGALRVTDAAWQRLLDSYQRSLADAGWVISGGSLPENVPVSCYRMLVELAHAARVPILIDTSGPPALEALQARPTILKMNRVEYAETFRVGPLPLADLKAHAESIASQAGLSALVLTCGREGILALTQEGAYLAVAPPQQQVNAAGAGDAVSAALAWRLAQGDSWPEALRWAAAAGAAVVLTEGTADCDMDDIRRILPDTTLQALGAAAAGGG